MKRILSALTLTAILANPALAGTRALFTGSYVSMTPEEEEDDKFTGHDAKILGQFDLLNKAGTAIYIGLGARMLNAGLEKEGVTYSISPVSAVGEFGMQFSLAKIVTLQAGISYDHGISGEEKVKGGLLEIKRDLESFSQIGANARLMFGLAPLVAIGVEPSFLRGSYKGKDADEKTKFESFAIGAVLKVGL